MNILLLGDIAFFGRNCIHQHPSSLNRYKKIINFTKKFDMIVGNLESPFVQDERPVPGKSAHLKSNPNNIEFLAQLGVTHVTLANNHIGDYGFEAFTRTVDHLNAARIDWFGVDNKVIYIDRKGERVSLHGYCSLNTNPSRLVRRGENILNLADVEKIVADLRAATLRGYLPILSIHSGQEHVHMPSNEDVAFARGVAEKLDYIYYGHHPHVVQGVERYKNSYIYYSLGNFIFDDVYTPKDKDRPLISMSEANKTGAMVSLSIEGGEVVESRIIPIYMGDEVIIGDEAIKNTSFDKYDMELLDAGTDEYHERRSRIIDIYLSARRSTRNFQWYVNRMNLNSMMMVRAAQKNRREYKRIFLSKLSTLNEPHE